MHLNMRIENVTLMIVKINTMYLAKKNEKDFIYDIATDMGLSTIVGQLSRQRKAPNVHPCPSERGLPSGHRTRPPDGSAGAAFSDKP